MALVDHVREPFLLLDSGAEEQNVCSSFHTREQTSPAEMFYMRVVGAEQSHRWCLLVSRHHEVRLTADNKTARCVCVQKKRTPLIASKPRSVEEIKNLLLLPCLSLFF